MTGRERCDPHLLHVERTGAFAEAEVPGQDNGGYGTGAAENARTDGTQQRP